MNNLPGKSRLTTEAARSRPETSTEPPRPNIEIPLDGRSSVVADESPRPNSEIAWQWW